LATEILDDRLDDLARNPEYEESWKQFKVGGFPKPEMGKAIHYGEHQFSTWVAPIWEDSSFAQAVAEIAGGGAG
jgi:hypothetical protein